MSAIIDTASEPGSWAETLASPSCKIQSRSALSAAGAGASNVSPVNSPAAGNGGGHIFSVNHHGEPYGE